MNAHKALKQWRARCGHKTQAAAAHSIGVSYRRYQEYESGRVDVPHSVLLACAAVEHGLPPISGKLQA